MTSTIRGSFRRCIEGAHDANHPYRGRRGISIWIVSVSWELVHQGKRMEELQKLWDSGASRASKALRRSALEAR
jgi:hypothetical protein